MRINSQLDIYTAIMELESTFTPKVLLGNPITKLILSVGKLPTRGGGYTNHSEWYLPTNVSKLLW